MDNDSSLCRLVRNRKRSRERDHWNFCQHQFTVLLRGGKFSIAWVILVRFVSRAGFLVQHYCSNLSRFFLSSRSRLDVNSPYKQSKPYSWRSVQIVFIPVP